MEENTHPVIHINIHGGNNQILPTATKAEQHFYFGGGTPMPDNLPRPERKWTEGDEARLSFYISNSEKLPAYIAMLSACKSAREVGKAVVQMSMDEPKITEQVMVTKNFIDVLLPFLIQVDKGNGVNNLRDKINMALDEYKEYKRRNRQ